jgi:predicted metal-dependent phosphoesterase TrpH
MEINLRKIDMHMHSRCSDGELSPANLVKECKKIGLKYIALTDHETTDGIPEAIVMGKKLGVRIITDCSAEFAVVGYNGKTEHILGYGMDAENRRLNSFLAFRGKSKIAFAKKAIENLKTFGFEISLEDVLFLSHGTIEDFHLWTAIFLNPENLPVLEQWQIENPKQFNLKFLKSGSTNGAKTKPTIKRLIKIIHKAGGIAIWAHPFWKRDNIRRIEEKAVLFHNYGLDGIEVCYSRHSKKQALFLHRIAQEFSMLETIGSDFHAFNRKGENRRIGKVEIHGIALNLPNLLSD